METSQRSEVYGREKVAKQGARPASLCPSQCAQALGLGPTGISADESSLTLIPALPGQPHSRSGPSEKPYLCLHVAWEGAFRLKSQQEGNKQDAHSLWATARACQGDSVLQVEVLREGFYARP